MVAEAVDDKEIEEYGDEIIRNEYVSFARFLKLAGYVDGFICEEDQRHVTSMFDKMAIDNLIKDGFVRYEQKSDVHYHEITPKGEALLEYLAPYFPDVFSEEESEIERKMGRRERYVTDEDLQHYADEIVMHKYRAYLSILRKAAQEDGFKCDERLRHIDSMFERMALTNLIKDGFVKYEVEYDGDEEIHIHEITPKGAKLLRLVEDRV